MKEPEIAASAAQTDAGWPEELCFGNIRAVPGYHYYPEFATIVRRQIELFRPDMVAVEVPGIYEAAMLRAVSYLPEITALVTPKDEMFPITPEDSLVEAVRSALANGSKIACIDLEITESRQAESEFTGSLADPVCSGTWTLSFMRLNAGKMGELPVISPQTPRRAHGPPSAETGESLQTRAFCLRHGPLEKDSRHLAGRPAKFQHDADNQCLIAELPVVEFHRLTGSPPYRHRSYERARTTMISACRAG